MSRTVDRVPAEDVAGLEAAPDFIDPLIIERHPGGPALALEAARLRGVPEVGHVRILDEFNGVCGPAALHRLTPDEECLR